VGVAGLALLALCGPAESQSNLDAGKSPAQIFSDNCGACHNSPYELKSGTVAFLRQHYTTGARQAATMAAYLESIREEPAPSPSMQAQQRRPSESVEETGTIPQTANGDLLSARAAAPMTAHDFEE
jgi:hypothetical protein